MEHKIELKLDHQVVLIEKGELVSYSVNAHEFIHQKGSPGWRFSDTEMFPIIGPLADADFNIATAKGNAAQDQHGHLRVMEYEPLIVSRTAVDYKKIYKANAPIKNPKFPKSPLEFMSWPYSFEFSKSYQLTKKGLAIEFKISGDTGMPFMLGYHPAFKIYTKEPIISAATKKISLKEVLKVGGRALEIANCNTVTLKDKKELTIRTQGFKHFMCWTEVTNMLCIEPISFYPYAVEQKELHKGFQTLDGETKFKVLLQPAIT